MVGLAWVSLPLLVDMKTTPYGCRKHLSTLVAIDMLQIEVLKWGFNNSFI